MGAQTSSSGEPPSIVIDQNRPSPEKPTSPSQVRKGTEMDCPRNLRFESPMNKCRVEQGLDITQESPSGTQDRGWDIVANNKRRLNNRNQKLRQEGRNVKRRIDPEDMILGDMRNPKKKPPKLRL